MYQTPTVSTSVNNNEGNISLNGNLALEAGHTITVDNIVKTAGGSQISLKSPRSGSKIEFPTPFWDDVTISGSKTSL